MATPAKTAPRAPPVSFREVSGRQKVLVNNVIERCDVLTKRFSKELSESLEEIQNKSVENVSRVSSNLRSGVGIVLQGCIVDSCVPGVAASRVLRKGDTIVSIDGNDVDESSVVSRLTGSDTAGSKVTIGYTEIDTPSVTKELVLTRIPSESLSDRKNMLELLRQLKVSSTDKHRDNAAAIIVEQTLDLWQKMVGADEDMRSRIVADAAALVESGHEMMQDMTDTVEKLHSMYDLERFISEQEYLQKRVPELEDQLIKIRPAKDFLAQQLTAKESELVGLQHHLETLSHEVERCTGEMMICKEHFAQISNEADTKLAQLNDTHSKQRHSNASLQAELDRVKRELKEAQFAHEMHNDDVLSRHDGQVEELTEEIDKMKEALESLNASLEIQKKEAQEKERKLVKVEANARTVKQTLDDSLFDVSAKLKDVEEELEASVHTAQTQKTRLEQLSVAQDTMMKTAETMRSDEQRLRKRLQELEAVSASLRQAVHEAKKQTEAAELDAHMKALLISAADAEIAAATTQHATLHDAHLAEQQTHTATKTELSNSLHTLRTAHDALHAQHVTLHTTSGKLEEGWRALRETHTAHELALHVEAQHKETQIVALKANVAAAASNVCELSAWLKTAQAKVAVQQAEALQHAKQINATTIELAAVKEACEAALLSDTQHTLENNHLAEHLQTAKQSLEETRQTVVEALALRTQQQRELETCNKALACTLLEAQAAEARSDELHGQCIESRTEVGASNLEAQRCNKLLHDSRAQIDALNVQLADGRLALTTAKNELKKTSEQCTALQMSKDTMNIEVEAARDAHQRVQTLQLAKDDACRERDARVPSDEHLLLQNKHDSLRKALDDGLLRHSQQLRKVAAEQVQASAEADAHKEALVSGSKALVALRLEFAQFKNGAAQQVRDLASAEEALKASKDDRSVVWRDLQSLQVQHMEAQEAAANMSKEGTVLRTQLQLATKDKLDQDLVLADKIRALEEALAKLSLQFHTAQTHTKEAQTHSAAVQQDNDNKDRELFRLQQKIEEGAKGAAAAEVARQVLANELDHSQVEVVRLGQEVDEVQRQLKVLQQEVADAKQQLSTASEQLREAMKADEVGQRARKQLQTELSLRQRDAADHMVLLRQSVEAKEAVESGVQVAMRQVANANRELSASNDELEMLRLELHRNVSEVKTSDSALAEARRCLLAAEATRDAVQDELDAALPQIEHAKTALQAERAESKQFHDEITNARSLLASSRADIDEATKAAEASAKQRDKLRLDLESLRVDLVEHVRLLNESQDRHSAVLNKHDILTRTHAQVLKILEETKEALDSTTVERDDVILEHSKCSKKQICGVGISVWDPDNDGLVEVHEIKPGMSCWLDSLKNPDDVLPEPGDRVKIINSRLINNVEMCEGLMVGEEGSVCEMVIDKKDGSGIFTCHIVRRPKM